MDELAVWQENGRGNGRFLFSRYLFIFRLSNIGKLMFFNKTIGKEQQVKYMTHLVKAPYRE